MSLQIYSALGYSIERNTETAVIIPGFKTPRVYDFIAQDPISNELIGVEVKTTYFDTVYLDKNQVDKDITLYLGNAGTFREDPSKVVTQVAYEAFCGACADLNVRYIYLAFELWMSGIQVGRHVYPGGKNAPF